MNKHIKAPAENGEKPFDALNPIDYAKVGVKGSFKALNMILPRKLAMTEALRPSGAKEKEQLAVAKNSVERRRDLALSFA